MSMQDRLKVKRVSSFEAWSIREQLCLASSVLKSGDQNWMSVSRSLKPFVEKELPRPPDWFSQRSCASQYTYLLENADTPKRKKRESSETASESIVRRLTQERITELSQILALQKDEYLRHKADISLLKSGVIIDEKLEKMWLNIQQEEREQEQKEQKARTHLVWIAKRQQKQEINLPSVPSIIGSQRKLLESTTVEVQESSVEPLEDDEKKNRGGRSPLLTSLLKSPSPTTQTQSITSTSVQSNSPTITSLLGSSSKILNTQLAQNVSPQLQQLVTTAISSVPSATLERPSVGAPTLSMLLEMPANSQRGSLPNLQATPAVTIIAPQTTQQVTVATAEVHNFPQVQQSQNVQHQITIQNLESSNITSTALAITAIPTTTNNIPISENMVQIIDNIDDVIRKDIMADVMDKDEINEIIGDIEELIKEEITARSPQTLQDTSGNSTSTNTTVIDSLNVQTSQQVAEIPVAVTMEPRPEPRDVDEAVSLSNSPQSEMAIEEIDSSTSNIAEIIGTVAIEPQEPKIIITEISENISNMPEEMKSVANTCDERIILTEELIPEQENSDGGNEKEDMIEEKQLGAETKSLDTTLNIIETEENKQDRVPDLEKMIEGTIAEEKERAEEENEGEEGETEMTISDDKDFAESTKERKEIPEDVEGKDSAGLDQLEMHLAKITGDQQDVPSAEVVSVSSDVTNDLPSTEDTEKSQDISLILEDDEEGESSRSPESKKKASLEQIIENTVESTTESLESFKEEPVLIKKEEIVVKVKEEAFMKSQEGETVEETLQIYTEELKKEEEETVKDSSEDTTSSILQDIEVKEEEIEPADGIENVTINTVTIQNIQNIQKSEPSMAVTTDVENMNVMKTENVEIGLEEPKAEREVKTPIDVLPREDKNEIVEVKEEKKEDIKKSINSEQTIKKEIECGVTSAGEEIGELDEEESSLSKLSGVRAMKTYSKRQQNISVDSEPENEGTGEGADYRAWKKAVMLVYNRLATHKYASIFLRPITEDQAPGYHTVIFRPMDLSTIKKNIDNGTIRSTMHFQRDVMLMFQNAIMYNKHDTFIYKMAVSMQEECLQHMQILVQVTGEGTFRRETRTAASSSSEASENNIKRKRSHITPSPHDTDSLRSKKRRKSEND